MMRRKKGTGSVLQRNDGRWMASFTTGYKNNGQAIKKYFYGDSEDCVANRLAVAISKHGDKRDETPRMRDNRQRKAFKKEAMEKGLLMCEVCGWDGMGWGEMVEAHHIIPFKDGGKVTDENIILLCPNHHAMIHKVEKIEDVCKSKMDIVFTIKKYDNEYTSSKQRKKKACDILGKVIKG